MDPAKNYWHWQLIHFRKLPFCAICIFNPEKGGWSELNIRVPSQVKIGLHNFDHQARILNSPIFDKVWYFPPKSSEGCKKLNLNDKNLNLFVNGHKWLPSRGQVFVSSWSRIQKNSPHNFSCMVVWTTFKFFAVASSIVFTLFLSTCLDSITFSFNWKRTLSISIILSVDEEREMFDMCAKEFSLVLIWVDQETVFLSFLFFFLSEILKF